MEPEMPADLFSPDTKNQLAAIAQWFDQRQSTGRAKETDSMHAAAYAHLAYMADIAASLRMLAVKSFTVFQANP